MTTLHEKGSIFDLFSTSDTRIPSDNDSMKLEYLSNDSGMTPLHFASGVGNEEVASLLISAGASVQPCLSQEGSFRRVDPVSFAQEICFCQSNFIRTSIVIRSHM